MAPVGRPLPWSRSETAGLLRSILRQREGEAMFCGPASEQLRVLQLVVGDLIGRGRCRRTVRECLLRWRSQRNLLSRLLSRWGGEPPEGLRMPWYLGLLLEIWCQAGCPHLETESWHGIDFFQKYKKELIRRVSWIGNSLQMCLRDILHPAEYEAIMAQRTDNQKMEKLYELLPSWDRRRKVQLYRTLKSTNRNLILQLEAGHFVEQEEDELIQRTSRVPEVLRKLEGVALAHDQYKDIMFEPTDILRLQKLYNLVPHWSKEQKDHLYQVLLDTNRFLITELKGKHFVDRHEHELVQRVSKVDSILQRLVPHPLDPDQYMAIITKSTDTQKMEKLYEIMLSWDAFSKIQLYDVLRSTNRRLILELEAQHLVERNKDELIHRMSSVPHVLDILKELEELDPHQYEKIMAAGTNRQKMKKLYELVSNWNDKSKDYLYQALRQTNVCLLKEIEGGHFVERYQKELIEKISGMDIILFRLLGFILSHDQYCHIMTEETDAGKMKKLFELVPAWRAEEKNSLYRELIQTNGPLTAALEGGSEPGNLLAYPSEKEHFIEKHQEELIRRATGVDIVLSFALSNELITKEQNQEIKGSPQQQMRKLFVLVESWMTAGKEKLQCTLRETNPRLIVQLAGGHFVDRYREELIERVTKVPLKQLRGFALDDKQYETLLNCATEKMQMQALFRMVQEWNRQQKDRLYQALVETNPDVVKVLEEEHFIEKHQEELIHRVSRVDAILRRLPAQHSLIKEGSDQQKMEQLYTLVPNWNRKKKDHLYMVLKKTNGPLVAELKEGHFVERHKEQLIQNVTKVKIVAQGLLYYNIGRRLYINLLEKDTDNEKMELLYKVVPDWNGEWKDRLYRELRATNEPVIKELEGRRSSKEGLVPNLLEEEKCYLCEKEKGVPEVQPELIPDAKGNLKAYRVHLHKAGTFLCSVTELKFEVRAAVTVKYTYSSWDQHLSEAEMQNWMVAGPLFDIHADPEGEVAAVHLPHFICLQEGKTDISQMKIAHFVDAGMILEEPSRVTQFHVVLENPEFSVLGVLLKPIQKLIPVHSVVLLYKICMRTVTLHLYPIPNDHSLIQAVEDREKSQQSELVFKHSQTDEPLYYGSRYTVFSSAELLINPKELTFSYKTPRQLQSFVDVYLENIMDRVNLSLKKREGLSVWDAWLQSGDLEMKFQALSLGSQCDSNSQTERTPSSSGAAGMQVTEVEPHFIERHREQLIQRTAVVEGVLDLLYGVLEEEQYQRISLRETNQDKMRELYRLVPSWDRSCKDRLLMALRKKNPFLIADLERK